MLGGQGAPGPWGPPHRSAWAILPEGQALSPSRTAVLACPVSAPQDSEGYVLSPVSQKLGQGSTEPHAAPQVLRFPGHSTAPASHHLPDPGPQSP